MIQKGLLVLFVFLSTLIYSIAANSYTFTEDFEYGIYWKGYPISLKIYGENQSTWQELYNFTNTYTSEWEDETGVNLWDVSSSFYSGNPSGNYMKWSSNFSAETGYDSSGTLAVTIRYNSGTYFDQVVIILNSENSSLKQNYGGLLEKTILHELGHTIGLGHSDTEAIMYPYSTNLSHLQNDDVNGAKDVIATNDYRSSIGFSANQNAEESGLFPSCGSMAFASTNAKKQSYFSTLITVFSALLMILFLKFMTYFIISYVKEIPKKIFKR